MRTFRLDMPGSHDWFDYARCRKSRNHRSVMFKVSVHSQWYVQPPNGFQKMPVLTSTQQAIRPEQRNTWVLCLGAQPNNHRVKLASMALLLLRCATGRVQNHLRRFRSLHGHVYALRREYMPEPLDGGRSLCCSVAEVSPGRQDGKGDPFVLLCIHVQCRALFWSQERL